MEKTYADVWRAVCEALADHPTDLMRFSQVCREWRQVGREMIVKGLNSRACMWVETYDERRLRQISVRPFTGDAAREMDHLGERHCEIIWGNLWISIRRYEKGVVIRVYVGGKSILWDCALNGVPQYGGFDSALEFVKWVLPGVYAG